MQLHLQRIFVSEKDEINDEKAQSVMQNEDSPNFVSEEEIKNINWDKTISVIGANGNNDIFGNPNKVGYVGPDLQAKKKDKWLW